VTSRIQVTRLQIVRRRAISTGAGFLAAGLAGVATALIGYLPFRNSLTA
jgi:hypothetical protein